MANEEIHTNYTYFLRVVAGYCQSNTKERKI